MEKYPAVAVLAAALSAVTGKAVDADRWAKTAERGASLTRLLDGSRPIEPWLALLCHAGAEKMGAGAEPAARTIAAPATGNIAGIDSPGAATAGMPLAIPMGGPAIGAHLRPSTRVLGTRQSGRNLGRDQASLERPAVSSFPSVVKSESSEQAQVTPHGRRRGLLWQQIRELGSFEEVQQKTQLPLKAALSGVTGPDECAV